MHQKYFTTLELFDVYESTNQIIVIGSNSDKTIYKILKLPRWTSNEKESECLDWFLTYVEDEYTYCYTDINKLKTSIMSMSSSKLLLENAYGIVGFVRFKQGYYLILITKRSQVAQLGQHKIYKVDETKMIYLPGSTSSPWDNGSVKTDSECYLPQTKHPDEKRYIALFNSVDLSIDNYFSYTYDLSNTVQYNMSFSFTINESNRYIYNGIHEQQLLVNDRFVWNWSLWPPNLKPTPKRIESGCCWLIPLIHGYVGQSCVLAGAGCVDIIVCLIARRSRHFAGTRFLKRGSNLNGNVANEVESEQIVYENEGLEFEQSKVTSLVQLRGSIPLQWHQETMKAIGKPPIEMTVEDSYYKVSGRHFANLIYRFGSPIIILNLVKQKEKHSFEGPLSKKFVEAINYLKSHFQKFNLHNDILKYIDFDMSRIQRSKYKTVLVKMAPIADQCIQTTGFFYSNALLCQESGEGRMLTKTIQCGVVRTNCIDCLDRTNTAQFVIGQAAFGYQLFALGVFNNSSISSIKSLDIMLQALYESHGNVLALQYGGSELVHNVESYRKTGKFSTQSRDFLQTISRYYNNKFSDHEKQMSINLFLGIFKPWESSTDTIWNHKNSDIFLHDKYCRSVIEHSENSQSLWLPINMIAVIPKPLVLWDKWCALNQLYIYASDVNLLAIFKRRISIIGATNNFESAESKFQQTYTHLIDIMSINRTTIDLLDSNQDIFNNLFKPSMEIDDSKSQNGNVKWWDQKNDVNINQMDAVENLSMGPVMAALRNEKFNDTKSVSSDSYSDISDDELGIPGVLKKNRQDQLNSLSNSLLYSGHEIDKNKYINFIITDYGHLSKNVGDCVNSSWNFFQANNKCNIRNCKAIENENLHSTGVSNSFYKEIIDFNKTGKMKISNKDFYTQYLNSRDFRVSISKCS